MQLVDDDGRQRRCLEEYASAQEGGEAHVRVLSNRGLVWMHELGESSVRLGHFCIGALPRWPAQSIDFDRREAQKPVSPSCVLNEPVSWLGHDCSRVSQVGGVAPELCEHTGSSSCPSMHP